MRILILVSVLTLVACNDEVKSIEVQRPDLSNVDFTKEYWWSETLKSIGKQVNGKREGEWKFYHRSVNNELLNICNYLNGIEDGEWKSYYLSGQLYETGNYVNGKKEGVWKTYYGSGQISEVFNYINGKREGKGSRYTEKGKSFNMNNVYENGYVVE